MLLERFKVRLNPEEEDIFDKILSLKRSEDPAFGFI